METKTQQLYNKAKESGKVSDVIPFLRLGIKKEGGGVQSTGPHTVKFVSDKIVKGVDYHTQKDIDEVEYLFEEDGKQKIYRVPIYGKDGNLHYLLQKMADFDYGDTIRLEMKKAGKRNVISVSPVGKPDVATEGDIPTIEEENYDDNSEDLSEV